MTDADLARRRYFAIVAARLAGVAGAVFALVLIGRATDTPTRLVGIALMKSQPYSRVQNRITQ